MPIRGFNGTCGLSRDQWVSSPQGSRALRRTTTHQVSGRYGQGRAMEESIAAPLGIGANMGAFEFWSTRPASREHGDNLRYGVTSGDNTGQYCDLLQCPVIAYDEKLGSPSPRVAIHCALTMVIKLIAEVATPKHAPGDMHLVPDLASGPGLRGAAKTFGDCGSKPGPNLRLRRWQCMSTGEASAMK